MRKDTENLFRAIGDVDNDLLDEALDAEKENAEARPAKAQSRLSQKKKPFRWRKILPLAAACLAVVLTAGILIPVLTNRDSGPGTHPDVSNPLLEQSGDPIIPDPSSVVLHSGAGASVPAALQKLSVIADGGNNAGRAGTAGTKLLSVDGSLLVRTASACDADTVAEYLTLSPSLPVSVMKMSDTEFRISPAGKKFAPNTVYRLSVGDPENPSSSFAFQTSDAFRVRSFFPADGARDVPTDTGIEVAFTEAVDPEGLSGYLKIHPATEGHFQLSSDRKTVIFVPEQPLKSDTLYSVQLSSGVKCVNGQTSETEAAVRFRTASVKTETSSMTASLSHADRRSACYPDTIYSPGEKIRLISRIIRTDTSGFMKPVVDGLSVRADVYRTSDRETAKETLLAYERSAAMLESPGKGIDLSKFRHVAEWTFRYDAETGFWAADGSFDAEGLYAVDLHASGEYGSAAAFGLFQVSSLRFAGASSEGKTVLFATDDKGQPLAGARLEGYTLSKGNVEEDYLSVSRFSLSAGDDGIAVLENGTGSSVIFTVTDGSGKKTAVGFDGILPSSTASYYMNYVYTDRPVYFTDDTVHFWGIIAGLYGSDVPEEMYLSTRLSSSRIPVSVTPEGYFEGSLELKKLSETYLTLSFENENGNVLASTSVRVTEEEKPVFRSSIELEKEYCRYGETVNGVFRLTFFDGTPAEGYRIRLDGYPFSPAVSVSDNVTDRNGEVKFSVKTGPYNASSTYPATVSIYAQTNDAGVDVIASQSSFRYYFSDYVFVAGREKEGVVVRLNHLDLTNEPQNVAGAPADGELSVQTVKYVTTVTETTVYDNYLKRARPSYAASTKETVVKSEQRAITGGRLVLDFIPDEGKYVRYAYRIAFRERGNSYNYEIDAQTYGEPRFRWWDDDTCRMNADTSECVVGEKAVFSVTAGNGDVIPAAYAVFSGGFLYASYGELAEVTFTKEMIPYCTVTGFCFDSLTGQMKSFSRNVYYKTSARSVDVEVKTDKDVYAPGEKMTVSVRNPKLANGYALISVVDEACFALSEKWEESGNDILSFFRRYASTAPASSGFYNAGMGYDDGIYYDYGEYYYGYRTSNGTLRRVSVLSPIAVFGQPTGISRNGADGAGGSDYFKGSKNDNAIDNLDSEIAYEEPVENGPSAGEIRIRERFENSAAFAVVPLDGTGKGVLSIDLPDNLTSWRVTAIAINGLKDLAEVYAGDGVSNLICTLPFQIKADVSSRYVKGDDVTAGFRCFGSAADGNALYTVTLENENGQRVGTASMEADVSRYAYVSFGRLETGSYVLTATASKGEHADGVRLTFDVVPSQHVIDRVIDLPTASVYRMNDLMPDVAAFPAEIIVRNTGEGEGFVRQVLSRLSYDRSHGFRSDGVLAAAAAKKTLSRLYGTEDDTETPVSELMSIFSTRGMLTLFPYSECDPALTAVALELMPDAVPSVSSAASYYESMLTRKNLTETELCIALYGLAAARQPVLLELCEVCDRASGYPAEAKLYLACAFASLGDFASAEAVLNSVLDTHGRNAGDNDEALYVIGDNGASDNETIVSNTSLALIAASSASRETADRLAGYLATVPHEYSASPDLALAMYASRYLPTGSGEERTVSYVLADGEEKTIKLKFGEQFRLQLFHDDFASCELRTDLNVSVRMKTSPDPEKETNEDGSILKTKITKEIRDDIVTLTISGTTNRRYASFRIDDVIPSGARFLTYQRNNWAYNRNYSISVWHRSGQRMEGYASVHSPEESKGASDIFCEPYDFEISVSYEIREAIRGTYVAESAILTPYGGGPESWSEPFTVTFERGEDAVKAALGTT